MPTNGHGDFTNGTSRKRPRAMKVGHTTHGNGRRLSTTRARASESSRHAAFAEPSTES